MTKILNFFEFNIYRDLVNNKINEAETTPNAQILTFYKEVNPRVSVTFELDSRGMLLGITNPMKVRLPFKLGDYIGRKYQNWAILNGYIQKDESARNKKIHGIKTKDLPNWHPMKYTGRNIRKY